MEAKPLNEYNTMSSETSSSLRNVEATQGDVKNEVALNVSNLIQNDFKAKEENSSTESSAMAAFLAEIKETNRLLKVLVAEKFPEIPSRLSEPLKGPQEFEAENRKYFEPYTEAESKAIAMRHALNSENTLRFRNTFLSNFNSWFKDTYRTRTEIAIFTAPTPLDMTA
jgi:hypothetical protein